MAKIFSDNMWGDTPQYAKLFLNFKKVGGEEEMAITKEAKTVIF